MIIVIKKKKEMYYGHLLEANLCETSVVPRVPIPEVGTMEDFDESVIVHL